MADAGVSATSPVQKVFICYRREETAAHAGRLYDAMVARFGERNVFMDVDIAPGVDFVERITEVVSGCLVLILVMGPSWATVEDEEGNPRIADPDDFVRLEVETALRRPDVTPIPVLVAGARMPKREELPQELRPIARRNALELSDARWAYDVGRLNTRLDELLGETGTADAAVRKAAMKEAAVKEVDAERGAAPRPGVEVGSSGARLVLEGMLLAGVTAFVARGAGGLIDAPDGTAGTIAEVVLRRAETWALVGAALAAWLALRTGRPNVLRPGMLGLFVGAIAGALGGAIYALPFYLPDPNLSAEAGNRYEVLSLAVTGGFLGALIGTQWRPPRLALGLAAGIVAGVLTRVLFNAATGEDLSRFAIALGFALAGVTISGLALLSLLAADRQRADAEDRAYAAAEP